MVPCQVPEMMMTTTMTTTIAKEQSLSLQHTTEDVLAEADRNRASSESPMIQAVNSSTKASAMEATISVTTANNSLG